MLLPSPRAQKCCSIHPGALRIRSAVAPHSGHQCCVNGELRAMEQRQPVRHHFESSLVLHTTRRQVEVTDLDVECDSASGLSTDAGCCTLQGEPPSSQHPWNRTRTPVVAKGVEGTATPASGRKQREGAPESAEEEHPKHRCIEPGQW